MTPGSENCERVKRLCIEPLAPHWIDLRLRNIITLCMRNGVYDASQTPSSQLEALLLVTTMVLSMDILHPQPTHHMPSPTMPNLGAVDVRLGKLLWPMIAPDCESRECWAAQGGFGIVLVLKTPLRQSNAAAKKV